LSHLYRDLLGAAIGLGCAVVLSILPASPAEPIAPPTAAAQALPAGLAFTAEGKEFRFDTGVLRGSLRVGGNSRGLGPVVDVATGMPVAGPYGLFTPYRLLTADTRFGTAAYDWTSQGRRLADGAVEARWLPEDKYPLELTAVYRWAAPDTLDLQVTVKPQQNARRFELYLASYLAGFPASLVYAQGREAGAKPGFVEAAKAAGAWQAFPRDDEAVKIINDGRWNRPPHTVSWKIMPRFSAPLAMRRDAKSGLAVVLMAPAQDCFAVMTPYGEEHHRSVYLSLFGRDLKAGETATARARLVIGRQITDDQAVALYQAYVQKP